MDIWGGIMKVVNFISKYFVCFVLYAIIGWCYEVFLEVFIYHWGFSNRGVLFGPYCPVYGFGALAFLLFLSHLKKKKIKVGKINITPFLVFLGVILIATTIELIASYLLEAFTGSWPWDYTRFGLDFEGRIALNPSLRFGIGGMIFLYILQPFIQFLLKKLGDSKTRTLALVLGLILGIDILYTFFLKNII